MSTFDASNVDLEANVSGENANNIRRNRRRHRRRRRRRRPSMAGSSETTTDGSFRFSDSDSDQSWHSPFGSATTTGGGSYSYEECESSIGCNEGGGGNVFHSKRRGSCPVSDEEIDLESGELELRVHREQKRTCRICHLSLLRCGGIGDDDQLLEPSGGLAIELGCSCKGDLAAAHKQCAETWFKIKGNTTCEICGATALNVVGGPVNETSSTTATTTDASNVPAVLSETQRFWHGRRIMNFLLASMIFAFVISWLFHFKIFP